MKVLNNKKTELKLNEYEKILQKIRRVETSLQNTMASLKACYKYVENNKDQVNVTNNGIFDNEERLGLARSKSNVIESGSESEIENNDSACIVCGYNSCDGCSSGYESQDSI